MTQEVNRLMRSDVVNTLIITYKVKLDLELMISLVSGTISMVKEISKDWVLLNINNSEKRILFQYLNF